MIAELSRRIPELETQVRRAKRFRRLSERVRDLELLSYMRASKSRREERDRVRSGLGKLDERQAGAAARAAALAAELTTLRTSLYRHELALEEQRVAAQEARAKLADLQTALAATHARREALEAQSSASVADEARAQTERGQLESAVSTLSARIAPLLVRVDEERAIEVRITATLAEARSMLDAAFNALRAFETAAAEKMASEAERRATIASADREITRFGDELGRLRDARRTIESNAASARERFGTGERELAALERDLEARTSAIAALDVQVQTDAEHLDSLQTQFTELHGQVASDESRLHTIEELEHRSKVTSPGRAPSSKPPRAAN